MEASDIKEYNCMIYWENPENLVDKNNNLFPGIKNSCKNGNDLLEYIDCVVARDLNNTNAGAFKFGEKKNNIQYLEAKKGTDTYYLSMIIDHLDFNKVVDVRLVKDKKFAIPFKDDEKHFAIPNRYPRPCKCE